MAVQSRDGKGEVWSRPRTLLALPDAHPSDPKAKRPAPRVTANRLATVCFLLSKTKIRRLQPTFASQKKDPKGWRDPRDIL